MSRPGVTYFTSSDRSFYPGTVALINSLRLTGNDGDVVVFDLGLTDAQRERLSAVATVKAPGVPRDHAPKVLPTSDEATGSVVVIDSDMIVVAPLDDIVEEAGQGKLCLFPDPDDRWFEEWKDAFELQAPLRRERYVCSGFIALSVARWPGLLERWTEANHKLPPIRSTEAEDPFRDVDQDALNAILMSEVAPGSIAVQPAAAMAQHEELLRVRIENQESLFCTDRGQPVTILHHSAAPKAWMPRGWKRDFRHAYVRLLPRVLFGDDVALRLEHDELPLWLRPTNAGAVTARAVRTTHAIPGTKSAAKALRAAVRAVRRARVP